MTLAQYILLGAVLVIGLPSSFRNLTAAALVLAYIATAGLYEWANVTFNSVVYLMIDATVIMAIYCKPPVEYIPYTSLRDQFAAAWRERNLWDRIVLGCFPFMWAAYFFGDFARWWTLWGLAIAQILAAGGDALQSYLKTRSAKTGDALPGPTGLEFALGRRGWRYG